ncbi:MAG: 3-hydroxyacyl-CoA dehydrogenase NAD-binding domain-containing protein [Candidatus Firestonebacteria bacterium]
MDNSVKLRIEQEIAFIEFDTPDSKVNILNAQTITEFEHILDELSGKNVKGIIIASKKENIFIAGADIKEIENITAISDGENKSILGQKIFDKLESFAVPTIAAIDGTVLGGGLELVLACKYRTASFNEKIRLGLPEVQLGILPGFGGTYRLPKLVGLKTALDLILTGKTISSQNALKIGLVDKLYPQKILISETIKFLNGILLKNCIRKKRKLSIIEKFLENTFIGRYILFNQVKKVILKQTKNHYPAPLVALEVIKKGYKCKKEIALQFESKGLGKLVITNVCKNLINVFYLTEKYRKITGVSNKDVRPLKINSCGVIGAGAMGGGISQLIAYHNITVRMKDINHESILKGLQQAYKVFKNAVKHKKLKPNDANFKMSLISGAIEYTGFKNTDFVIEAIIEDINFKKKLFNELQNHLSDKTIIASNTSSLSITEMGEGLKNPANFIGMHFFNPVHKMPLVEIIKGKKTSDETIITTVNFTRQLGKMPIVVNDSCGFLVNRILLPYMNEAAYFLEEGIKIDVIDKIMIDFGMPMGPLAVADEVGIDVGYKVFKILENAFGDRMKVASILEKVYELKLYGKKTKKGFYIHSGKRKIPNLKIYNMLDREKFKQLSKEEILNRMIYTMINEAAKALEEGVTNEPSDIDIGMIMGTGFPPFLGGLLRYADETGINNIVNKLEIFYTSYGERFKVSNLLINMAKQNKKFY